MDKCLITGGIHDPFLPKIREAINQADEIELAVAFIKSSGLELIFQALIEAVAIRGTRLTVLTSDYLDVTDPQALRSLMLLAERGANIRLYHTSGSQSFHLKAYIFVKIQNEQTRFGTAFIGSSNISKTALTGGIEWNYRLHLPENPHGSEADNFNHIRAEFRALLNSTQVIPLDYDWIDTYEKRRRLDQKPVAPGSSDPELPIPDPNFVQHEALKALADTRTEGYIRGLVVMATGLGKTHLAAFDSLQLNAKRLLFVAHREEILIQAEAIFQRVHPGAKVGYYSGAQKDPGADMLFASIQTLTKSRHLEKFPTGHFDYMVVDEFHHASAPTYRKLLAHFQPRFLLGLTATPERTDQSNILSLCDDNLVFDRDLFYGVSQEFLCPFTYYGIYDESVDYKEIPWRNGKFDPDSLSNKLATLARAKHAFDQWQDKAQSRTLAFCVSKKHAQFMADRFQREGIRAGAVYGGSLLARDDALEQMRTGRLQVIFSVELFNEGIDLPAIDTVMMLRPTESKVMFLQQLGRGLRKGKDKERLVVLDFIGNHQGFLNKPQALFGVRGNNRDLADFARRAKEGRLDLPPGCYVNYDLEIIEFLIGLAGEGPSQDYQTLKDTMGRRPTLTEYYRSGASCQSLRKQYGFWWGLISDEGDLTKTEQDCINSHEGFLKEVETTRMTKSFKAILLETLLENDGFRNPPTLEALASQALTVFRRRRNFIADILKDFQDFDSIEERRWLDYWKRNPVNAWVGGNLKESAQTWFAVQDGRFKPTFSIDPDLLDVFHPILQEILDYRFAAYEPRLGEDTDNDKPHEVVLGFDGQTTKEIPFFTDLKIACGHFRTGESTIDEYRKLGANHGELDPSKHFIARAIGDSMNGGQKPICGGDHLLLERLDLEQLDTIVGETVAVEQKDERGEYQYLLRTLTKTADQRLVLKAARPGYTDYIVDENMSILARLRAILDPIELVRGLEIKREDIPELFGLTFNPGNWNSGHVVLGDLKAFILLVTLNKQGKSKEHRYQDYFMDDHERKFHWQSQNSTSPDSKRGRELIEHKRLGISIHLFVRKNKMAGDKAAPFKYIGPVSYLEHNGSRPMNVVWEVDH